jgi:hypothetical protein
MGLGHVELQVDGVAGLGLGAAMDDHHHLLASHLDDCRERRIETVKKGTLVEFVYSGRMQADSDGHALVQALQSCPGVVGVEVLFPDPGST